MDDIFINSDAVDNYAAGLKPAARKTAVKGKKKRKLSVYLIDLFEKSAIVALLIGMNFILFAGAGSFGVFPSSLTISPEVVSILIVIAVVSFILMYLFSFSEVLQSLLAAFVAAMVTLACLNQFALFDKASIFYNLASNYLGIGSAEYFMKYSHYMLLAVVMIVVFWFVQRSEKSTIAYFVGILTLIFVGLGADIYARETKSKEWVVRYEDSKVMPMSKGKKFVFIGMPNLGSYTYLREAAGESNQAKTALNAMLGFYNNNNFTVYVNTFVKSDDAAENMARSLNLTTEGRDKFLLKQPMAFSFWDFDRINEDSIYLKENKIFDTFSRAGYGINAYQTHGLDLCFKNNALAVNRCVEKNNIPSEVEGKKISILDKTLVLAGQWLESTKLFDGSSASYSLLNTFMNVDNVALVGTSYDKLYVIDAPKILDVAANDIIKTNGDAAFFIYYDLPSDMYVYDEFCQLKPVNKWVRKDDLGYGRNNIQKVKEEAYFAQTACAYAKLEEFMNKLYSAGEEKNVVVMIQGLNGISNTKEDRFVEKLQNNQSVSMALKDPMFRGFGIKKDTCMAPDVLKKYLFKRGECNIETDLNLTKAIYNDLNAKLAKRTITKEEISNASKAFDEWYKKWQKVNYPNRKFVDSLLNSKKKLDGLDDVKLEAPKLREENQEPEKAVQSVDETMKSDEKPVQQLEEKGKPLSVEANPSAEEGKTAESTVPEAKAVPVATLTEGNIPDAEQKVETKDVLIVVEPSVDNDKNAKKELSVPAEDTKKAAEPDNNAEKTDVNPTDLKVNEKEKP